MKNLLIYFIFLSLLSSCASWLNNKNYLQTREPFYTAYRNGNYQLAIEELDKIKYLKTKRNKQLYLLEKGRLMQLLEENEKAAKLLNEADELAEGWKNIRPNSAVGYTSFSNNNTQFGFSQIAFEPSSLKYAGEHYERMMINYTKAISYIKMGKKDETLVEAKRLLLLSQQLGDLKAVEYNYKAYVKDPFPELFAGLIYEWLGDYSNAFVSYENAYICYSDNGTNRVYGINTPTQLQDDLLRLSNQLGYNDKLEFYQNIFGKKYQQKNNPSELILFIEDGTIPSRSEDVKYYIFDTLSKSSIDNTINRTGNKLFLPVYRNYYQERNISVNVNNSFSTPTTIRNNNYVVMNTLNSRVERERANLFYSFENTLKSNYQKMLDLRKEQEIAQVKAIQAAQKPIPTNPIPAAQTPKNENPTPNRPKAYNNNQINKQQIVDYHQNKQAINKNVIQDNQNIQKPQSKSQSVENNNTSANYNHLNNSYQTSQFSNNYNHYNNFLNPITSSHVDVRNWLSISAKVSYIRIPLEKDIDNRINVNIGGREINLSIKGTEGLQFKQVRFENIN